jgi:hypothetical protein
MESIFDNIGPLFQRIEQYSNTRLEILKYKTIEKMSYLLSGYISRFVLLTTVLVFVLTLNVGVSLWLGELIGKIYYGFLVVAAIYGVLVVVLLLTHPRLKNRINDTIISQLLHKR